MKKIALLLNLIMALAVYSSGAFADHRGYRGHGYGHRHHYDYDRGGYGYAPPPRHYRRHAPAYYPEPAPVYYQQPAPQYYQQPRHEQYYQAPQYQPDPRSHQGLAGGVLGSVLGYEMGSGDPIAAGLGAAAGSYLGNGLRGR